MRIPVHNFKSLADGSVEIMIHGSVQDANYVKGVFAGVKGAEVSEPFTKAGTEQAGMIYITTSGTAVNPLPVWKVKELLEADQHIELNPTAFEKANFLFEESRKPKDPK